MTRSLLLALLLAGCASDPPPPPADTFTPSAVYAPPEVYMPPAAIAPAVGAFPPSGVYAVAEHVTIDTCHPGVSMLSHVTVLTSRSTGSVPVPSRRLAVTWQGFKTCEAELRNVTNTSFTLAMTSCPDSTCRVEASYDYRLETLVCDSRCSGTVPGMRPEDVPPGPAQIQCVCP